MFWADKTHFYSATDCLHTGSPCPAAVRLINKLSEALSKAEAVTTANFEITGQTRLPGCHKNCPAQYNASHELIRIYCGVSKAADSKQLARFADAVFSVGNSGHIIGQMLERPCALAQANPNPAAPTNTRH